MELILYPMRIFISVFIALSALTTSAQFNTIVPIGSAHNIRHNNVPVRTIPNRADTVTSIVNENSNKRRVTTNTLSWCHPPLKGTFRVSSGFGLRRNPFGRKSSEHHNGIDLSAKAGTPIYAMLPGEVAYIGYDPRSGNYIKLRHGNFTVSYCHLIRKPKISVGSKVFPGQTVAHVGSTGRSTGPHLHITLKRNGGVIDPAILMEIINGVLPTSD